MTLFDFGSLYCDGIDLRRSPHTHNDKIESNVEVFKLTFQCETKLIAQDDVLCKICCYDCPASAMVKLDECGCSFCKEVIHNRLCNVVDNI